MKVSIPVTLKLTAIFLLLYSSMVHPVGIVDIHLPSDSTVSWIGTDVNHNGIPMKIQKFSSERSVDDVLEHFRQSWAPLGDTYTPGFVETSVGGWSVISMLNPDDNIVVQIRSGVFQATEGFISSIDPHKSVTSLGNFSDVPTPDGSHTVSTTSSSDMQKTGTTVLITTEKGVSEMYRYYQSEMSRNGWTPSATSERLETAVLMFHKKSAYCEITISPTDNGMTILMINRVSGAK